MPPVEIGDAIGAVVFLKEMLMVFMPKDGTLIKD